MSSSPDGWRVRTEPPDLPARSVHCWLVDLDHAAPPLHESYAVLSEHERLRAESFLVPRELERFISGRGWLRMTLGRYVGQPPGEVALRAGAHGRPELAGSGTDLRFSIAHSGPLLLAGFSRGFDVGADVERIREDWPVDDVAPRVLSPAEIMTLERAPQDIRRARFFTYWVRKEAILKAEGTGVAVHALEDVCTASGSEATSVTIPLGGSVYRVIDVPIDARHRAAVAITPAVREVPVGCYRFRPFDADTSRPS